MDVEIQRPREVGSCRVVKVDKEAAWELFTTQAANEGRTVAAHFGASWCDVRHVPVHELQVRGARPDPPRHALPLRRRRRCPGCVFQAGGEGHAHLLPHQGQGGGEEDRRRQPGRAPQDGGLLRRRLARLCCYHSS